MTAELIARARHRAESWRSPYPMTVATGDSSLVESLADALEAALTENSELQARLEALDQPGAPT